jgi:hypothetical protein
MKNQILIVTICSIFVYTACKKENQTPTNSTPIATTTTAIPKDSIPLAGKNTFIIAGTTYLTDYIECTTEGASFYYLNETKGTTFCKFFFKNKPTSDKKYTCVSKQASLLSSDESAIEIVITNSAGTVTQDYYSNGGSVIVKMNGSKTAAFFNKITMKENTTMKIDSASASIACP